ncbi:MAG: SRPBCC family protein [Deltaproteobacteria bacterium]|nr:SRPBCC family protein [Deltaproteobacteria bacterium]
MTQAAISRSSAELAIEVALRYGRAKSQQDLAGALACCTEDFVLETLPFQSRGAGRAEVEVDLRLFFEQFPDYAWVPTGHAFEGSVVTLYGRATMTWSGRIPRELARPWERLVRLPRRRIDVPAVAVLDMRDGLIARERFHFDMREFCAQLGLPARIVLGLLRRAERHRHRLVDGRAAIRTEHTIVVDAPIERVYAHAFADVTRIQAANPRWPFPRATRIELVGAPTLCEGAIRRVHLTTGHVTDELIEACRPPHLVRYRIANGWGMLLDAVIAATSGEHELEPTTDGRTIVTWRSWTVPRAAVARPIVELLIRTLLAPMQQRFLRAIARDLK